MVRCSGFLLGAFVVTMNLRINFIQPPEIRSASMVSVKFILQIAGAIIPLIMVLFLAQGYISYYEYKSKLDLLQGTWAGTETQVKRAQELSQKLQARRQARDEISGWEQSKFPWFDLLAAIRAQVPSTVQLKVLQARQTLDVPKDGYAQRSLRIILNGRSQGSGAEDHVKALSLGFSTKPPLSEWVKESKVTGFREDTEEGAGPEDRAFQLEVDFIARRLHATAAK